MGPAGLVVADELSIRIRGQGGFAGAGQAEQNGGIVVSTYVGRAVHGEITHIRQQVVHHGENCFFHQPAVVRTTHHQANPVAKVDDRGPVRAAAVAFRLAAKRLHVEHGPALISRILDTLDVLGKHVVGEHGMCGVFTNEAIRHGIGGVGAGVNVLHVQVSAALVYVLHHAF